MNAQNKKIVPGLGLSNLNLGIFFCPFDVCRASQPFPLINYGDIDIHIQCLDRLIYHHLKFIKVSKRLHIFVLSLNLISMREINMNRGNWSNQLKVRSHGILNYFCQIQNYTWVERDTLRVKCPAQEHNSTSPTSAQTARSGVECTYRTAAAITWNLPTRTRERKYTTIR